MTDPLEDLERCASDLERWTARRQATIAKPLPTRSRYTVAALVAAAGLVVAMNVVYLASLLTR